MPGQLSSEISTLAVPVPASSGTATSPYRFTVQQRRVRSYTLLMGSPPQLMAER